MKTQLNGLLAATLLFAATGAVRAQPAPLGTLFTYQGRLNTNGVPASGVYDFQFALSNAPSGGSLMGGPITRLAVRPLGRVRRFRPAGRGHYPASTNSPPDGEESRVGSRCGSGFLPEITSGPGALSHRLCTAASGSRREARVRSHLGRAGQGCISVAPLGHLGGKEIGTQWNAFLPITSFEVTSGGGRTSWRRQSYW
jgi:hypothetical protein